MNRSKEMYSNKTCRKKKKIYVCDPYRVVCYPDDCPPSLMFCDTDVCNSDSFVFDPNPVV